MYLFTAHLCIYSQPIYVYIHRPFLYLFTGHFYIPLMYLFTTHSLTANLCFIHTSFMYLFTTNLCIYSQPIYVFFHSQFMYLFTAHLLIIQVTLTVDAVIFYRVFEPVRAACLLQVPHKCSHQG